MTANNIGKYYLYPGYIFISEAPYMIHTVLGSCVSVCLWDEARKYGGMNHYIYSKPFENEKNCKFGSISIRYMLTLMYGNGSQKKDLRAHIVGGGYNKHMNASVGDANIEVAEEILGKEGISIVTRDTGGQTGRKVIFNNSSGEILVYKGINVRKGDWYDSIYKQD